MESNTIQNARRVQKSWLAKELEGTGRSSDQVDRRLHNRALADLDVQVTRLKKQEQRVRGRIEDVSDTGVCIILPCELHPDEMVKLEAADSTLYGYVVHSAWTRNAYRTGVEVERVLLGGTDLAQLLRSVLEATLPEVPLQN